MTWSRRVSHVATMEKCAAWQLTFTSLPSLLHSANHGIKFSISATVLAMSFTLFESAPTCSLVNCVVCKSSQVKSEQSKQFSHQNISKHQRKEENKFKLLNTIQTHTLCVLTCALNPTPNSFAVSSISLQFLRTTATSITTAGAWTSLSWRPRKWCLRAVSEAWGIRDGAW